MHDSEMTLNGDLSATLKAKNKLEHAEKKVLRCVSLYWERGRDKDRYRM